MAWSRPPCPTLEDKLLDIVGKRYWYFLLSLLIIVPGTVALLTVHLKLGTDFTGGTEMTISIPQPNQSNKVSSIVGSVAGGVNFVQAVVSSSHCPSDCQYLVRIKEANAKEITTIGDAVQKQFPGAKGII